MAKARAALRCTAHGQKTGKPCPNPAISGMTVCWRHGGRAPQVRAAAALRLAMAADPMVRELVLIGKNRKHPHQLQAIKEILERNGLDAFGKPVKNDVFPPQPTTTAQISAPTTLHLESLSDEGLDLVDRRLHGLLATQRSTPTVIEGHK